MGPFYRISPLPEADPPGELTPRGGFLTPLLGGILPIGAALAALLLSACVSTTQEGNTTGVELAKANSQISTADDTNSPVLAAGPDGSLHVIWAEANQIRARVSMDGGETFGATQDLLAVNDLGNITAGRNQPRPLAAAIDDTGDTHLLIQVSDPVDGQRSDIYYTHVETYAQDTDKALVTGGQDLSGQAVSTVAAYDPRTRQWEPADRTALGTGLICDAGSPTAQDATRRWGHASATVGGTLYVAGGSDAAGPMDLVQAYDTTSRTWLTEPALPGPRTGHSLVSNGTYLYAFGGEDGSVALGSILRYDPTGGVVYAFDPSGAVTGCTLPASSPWTVLGATMPIGRTRLAAVGVTRQSGNFEIFVIGGQTFDGTPLTNVDAYRVATDGTLFAITPPPPLPEARAAHQAVAIGERLFVLGGTSDGSDIVDTVWTLNLADASPAWVELPPMPVPRRDHVAVVLSGKIYVLAGSSGAEPIALVDVYDPDLGVWRTDRESSSPGPAYESSVAVIREPSDPRNLSRQAANATQPALTRDPDTGDLYAVWRNEQEVTFGQFDTRVVSDVYLTRSADGGDTFTETPVRLSALGPLASLNSNFSGNPTLAVAANHLIHMAWIETGEPSDPNGAGQDLVYTNCAPESTSEPNGIDCNGTILFFASVVGGAGSPPAGTLRSPTIAVDDATGVYLAWVDQDGTVPIAQSSANRTYALNVYFASRRTNGTFTTPVPIGVPVASRQDELFPAGTVSDPVAAVAGLVTEVDLPVIAAYGEGQVNVLWTNDAEVRLRHSGDGGQTFLDEVGVAALASGTSRISPDLAYQGTVGTAGRMTALWQDLTAGAAAGEVNSLVESRFVDPL
jgi:hypothetical protein